MRSVTVQFRPWAMWPGKATDTSRRKRAPFEASWTRTLDDLDRELYHLGARAITLALAALRAVDRYGVTKRGEQYTGWKALPASTQPAMTTEQAAKRVVSHAPTFDMAAVLRDRDACRMAVRSALGRTHPDAGGSNDAFALVTEAKRVLTAHHGGAL